MGGEWALGVALVMELWPNASRAWLAGLDRRVRQLRLPDLRRDRAGLNHTAPGQLHGWLTGDGLPDDWAAALTANRNWRLLMLVGAVPALLTLFIRLFVPESEKWTKEKEAGKASHWSRTRPARRAGRLRGRVRRHRAVGGRRGEAATGGFASSGRSSGWSS